ncbi:MAG: hypothetical protein IJ097_00055 [Bacilli bacterium]|nr:hypothetical protein [Bacilli bacterium]
MKEILKEIIKEASIGKVIIDNEEWPIRFNSIIYKDGEVKEIYNETDSFSTLIIKDEDKFYKLLEEYIYIELINNRKTPVFCSDIKRNKIKWLISYLFVNARTQDFSDPINYLRKSINFLKDTTLDYFNNGIEIELEASLLNSKLIIKKEKNPTTMETPYRIELTLKNTFNNEEVEYKLPAIYYGISDNTCYIYSLLNPKEKKEVSENELKYRKKINRILYKLNEGVEDIEDYYAYKNGDSDYYPEENITDITHSFLLSLDIFTNILRINNIKNIKAIPYLPVRYASRFISAEMIDDEEKKNKLFERNNSIQMNTTNKFIRTFRRLSYHDKNITIRSYPYEVDEFLTMSINKKSTTNNKILDEVEKNIKKQI